MATRRRKSSPRVNQPRLAPKSLAARTPADLSGEIRRLRHGAAPPDLAGATPLQMIGSVYRQLFDFAPVIWMVLDPNAIILDVTAAGCAALGAGGRFIVGTPLLIWTHHDSRELLLEHMHRCRRDARPVETELELRAADSRPRAVRLHSRQMLFHGQMVLPTVAVDVSERQRLELARASAERQRDTADRERRSARAAEAAKDRLIAMVSHELRNPLNPVLIAAARLAAWPGLPDGVRTLAATMRRNIEAEARLIDDLLDIARNARGQFELRVHDVDLHDVVARAVDACGGHARARGISINLNLQADRHHVRGDAARLEQVMSNVFGNAIKFSAPGGQVIIRTLSTAAGLICVSVRDFGAGMDDSTVQRLFAPFEGPRVDERAGLGLGLTIARGLIERHGGRIWGASDGPGLGSMFEIELATSEPPARVEAPTPGGAPVAASAITHEWRGGRGRVLIVEDHEDTGEMLAACLSEFGFEVTLAQTLAAGLGEVGRPWDAVLSDIGLRDGSGLEVARRFAAVEPRPRRLVALSGYGAPADIEASNQAGFDSHLVKPVDLDRLLAILEPDGQAHGGVHG